MSVKAAVKYSVTLSTGGLSWRGVAAQFVSLLLAKGPWPEVGYRENYVRILNRDGVVLNTLSYGPYVENAKGKVALLREDLETLTVVEFEKRYLSALGTTST